MEALRKHHAEEIEHHKKEIERLQKEIDRHRGKIRKLKHDDWSCRACSSILSSWESFPCLFAKSMVIRYIDWFTAGQGKSFMRCHDTNIKKNKALTFWTSMSLILSTSLVYWFVQRTIGCLLLVLFTAVVLLLYSPTYLVTLPKQHIQKVNQRLNAAFRLCPFRTSYLIICKAYELFFV